MTIIEKTFVKDYFDKGHNLHAIVFKYKGRYFVELGHFSRSYKREENSLKMYKKYLSLAKQHKQ